MSPATPFPASFPPQGQAALQKERLRKAHGAIPILGTSRAPAFSQAQPVRRLHKGNGCDR